MNDCVFCKIITSEIPCKFLHEDDKCVVFKDIHPKDNTHLLIVPKKHIHSISEMEDGDEKIAGHLLHVAKKLGQDLGLSGYKLQINVGKDGGQEIFHLHVHLLSKLG
ncbi:MAG: histidine triad nucleotide-binding protein [Candidatus Peregrinibacteria bacterium]|nr:histidine triad nucleotide-binding protein [Candidatus Peregrinibacteria bacterium]